MKTEHTKSLQFWADSQIYSRAGVYSKLNVVEYPFPHFHEFYEIVIVLQGQFYHYHKLLTANDIQNGTWSFDKTGYPVIEKDNLEFHTEILQSGNIQIVPPNLCHYYSFIDPNTEYINITVTKSIAEKVAKLINQSEIFNFNTISVQPHELTSIKQEFLEIKNGRPSLEYENSSLEIILLVNTLRFFINQKQNAPSAQLPALIQEIISLMQNPNYYAFSIDSILSKVPYSHSHICRLFKQSLGVSLKHYWITQKLHYACHLLTTTDYKIITIANMLGYNNQSFFAKTFKEELGLTPQEYRKTYQLSL